MDTNVIENLLKQNQEMLGSIVGWIGRLEDKIGDIDGKISSLQENSGSRAPISEVGPSISGGDDEEDVTNIFKLRVPGKITEYLTAADEVNMEDPLPITHEVLC
jgi:hypothetical protein